MHLFLKRRLRQIKGKEMSEEQLLKASKEQHDIEGLLHVMTSGEKTQPRNVAADLAAFLQKTRANTTPMASSSNAVSWRSARPTTVQNSSPFFNPCGL